MNCAVNRMCREISEKFGLPYIPSEPGSRRACGLSDRDGRRLPTVAKNTQDAKVGCRNQKHVGWLNSPREPDNRKRG